MLVYWCLSFEADKDVIDISKSVAFNRSHLALPRQIVASFLSPFELYAWEGKGAWHTLFADMTLLVSCTNIATDCKYVSDALCVPRLLAQMVANCSGFSTTSGSPT